MVGSETRKARATSLVERPPSSRRVSATCASVESAGWQQVKMRRSRSSCTAPTFLEDAGVVVGGRERGHLAEQFPSTRLAAQAIDGTVAGGRRDPAARVGRQAVARPLAEGDGERLLHRILGDLDVTEDADQGSHRSAGLLAEDPADLGLVEPGCGVA